MSLQDSGVDSVKSSHDLEHCATFEDELFELSLRSLMVPICFIEITATGFVNPVRSLFTELVELEPLKNHELRRTWFACWFKLDLLNCWLRRFTTYSLELGECTINFDCGSTSRPWTCPRLRTGLVFRTGFSPIAFEDVTGFALIAVVEVEYDFGRKLELGHCPSTTSVDCRTGLSTSRTELSGKFENETLLGRLAWTVSELDLELDLASASVSRWSSSESSISLC